MRKPVKSVSKTHKKKIFLKAKSSALKKKEKSAARSQDTNQPIYEEILVVE